MGTIILTQTFPLYWTLSLLTIVATVFFIFRLRLGRGLLSKFVIGFPPLNLPAVLIAGVPQSGKTSLFNTLSGKAKTFDHGYFKSSLVTTKSGEKFQLVDLPRHVKREDLDPLKPRTNLVLFLFDVSPNSFPVATQVSLMKKIEDYFKDAVVLPVLNIKERIDKEKLKNLKKTLNSDIPLISVKKRNLKNITDMLDLHLS